MTKNGMKWLLAVVLTSGILQANAGQTFGCLIEPYRVAEVGSQVIGIVESIMVERGDNVVKGQVIAILRADVERASVSAAHTRAEANASVQASVASLEFDRQRLKRADGLLGKNFISIQAVDQIRAETDISEQKLNQAREQQRIAKKDLSVASAQLSQRTVRSPFDGVIADLYVSVGERIEEKPLVRVAKIDQLRVQVVVPVTYYGKIVLGATVVIMPDFPGAPTAMAVVERIDKVVDAASNTFRVQLDLANPDMTLPAGLRCKADFGIASLKNNTDNTKLTPAIPSAPISQSIKVESSAISKKSAPQSGVQSGAIKRL